jgi:hypothetical protein
MLNAESFWSLDRWVGVRSWAFRIGHSAFGIIMPPSGS